MWTLDDREADLRSMIEDNPVEVIWQDESYQAIVSPLDHSMELAIGGESEMASISAIMVKSDFGDDRPKERDVVTIDGDKYVILSVVTCPGYPQLEIRCGVIGGGA